MPLLSRARLFAAGGPSACRRSRLLGAGGGAGGAAHRHGLKRTSRRPFSSTSRSSSSGRRRPSAQAERFRICIFVDPTFKRHRSIGNAGRRVGQRAPDHARSSPGRRPRRPAAAISPISEPAGSKPNEAERWPRGRAALPVLVGGRGAHASSSAGGVNTTSSSRRTACEFDVNNEARSRGGGLTVSSKLLRVARKVGTRGRYNP